MIKGIVFDMDGVLADNHLEQRAAWKKVVAEAGLDELTPRLFNKYAGRRNEEILEGLSDGKLSKEEIDRFSHEKELHYRKLATNSLVQVKGLVEFLNFLKDKGYRLAIATSAPSENVELVLNKFRISDIFACVFDAKDVVHGKPDPEIYERACKALGYEPWECYVFEDSRSGIRSAKAAGCKVGTPLTGLSMEEAEEESPDLIFQDFTDPRLFQIFDDQSTKQD
jgi:HAD superfamily hydrolase (TIGR01509 family)